MSAAFVTVWFNHSNNRLCLQLFDEKGVIVLLLWLMMLMKQSQGNQQFGFEY